MYGFEWLRGLYTLISSPKRVGEGAVSSTHRRVGSFPLAGVLGYWEANLSGANMLLPAAGRDKVPENVVALSRMRTADFVANYPPLNQVREHSKDPKVLIHSRLP